MEDKPTAEDFTDAITSRKDIFRHEVEENPMLMASVYILKTTALMEKYNLVVQELYDLGFHQFPKFTCFMGWAEDQHGPCQFDSSDLLDCVSQPPAPRDLYLVEGDIMRAKEREIAARPPKPKPDYAKRIRRRLGAEPEKWVCAYCQGEGTKEFGPDGRIWHVDHMYPQVHGGDDKPDNKILACATCNGSKGSKTAIEHVRNLTEGKANVQ